MGQVPNVTIHDFNYKKEQRKKITLLTCYDYPSACTIAESNIDGVLVGDSLAMAVHGYDSTIMATMDMMVMHTAAVARGLKHQFLISDLPFLCHRGELSETVGHVKRLLQAGAKAIKVEGGDAKTCETIHYLITAGVPVMGHLGLTPQSIHQLGGYKVQGKSEGQARLLLQQARDLEAAGCFAIVLECIPQRLAKTITKELGIPTIGIGAGNDTDGQVLVWHDLLGLQPQFKARFIKQFAQGHELFLKAINAYVEEVHQTHFPAEEHAF